ncbi:putative Snf1-related kinase interactor 1 [Quillaja saponaria]|uniref:Snf1-related kinase interactor 1 n=1 Tax=Quillaja saponaria TaxID=32244 RepID=A0AAD7PP47_QUISA|nr:putative Snf1-related kinase interactor 1 [Quillaja saponaria]
MENHDRDGMKFRNGVLDGFATVSSTRIGWKSRRRSGKDAATKSSPEDSSNKLLNKQDEPLIKEMMQDSTVAPVLTKPYPKGWLIGKKRKLVNVDVVEKMRRIAVQEMNRKDREIGGLNEQLEEDARCLEHLQIQLVEERSKRAEVQRENAMLQEQATMLMDMLQENEQMGDEDPNEP